MKYRNIWFSKYPKTIGVSREYLNNTKFDIISWFTVNNKIIFKPTNNMHYKELYIIFSNLKPDVILFEEPDIYSDYNILDSLHFLYKKALVVLIFSEKSVSHAILRPGRVSHLITGQ